VILRENRKKTTVFNAKTAEKLKTFKKDWALAALVFYAAHLREGTVA